MNITTSPLAVAIDTASNLLAFLEMAKDPDKLKAVLDQIKAAQDAATAAAKAAEEAKADAASTRAAAQAEAAEAAAATDRAREEMARAARANAESDTVRETMREERTKFDNWMASQREALDAAQAKVDADREANRRLAEHLQQCEARANSEFDNAKSMQAAAETLRAEYEQKIAALKSLV